MSVRRLLMPLTLTAMAALCVEAAAQGAFPAPNQSSSGIAEQQDCMEKFAPLRQDAEKRAQALKTASERNASPQEACGLIKTYVQAEARLVNYVTTKQTACGIPEKILDQLRDNQKRSNDLMKAVCAAAANERPRIHRGPFEQPPDRVPRDQLLPEQLPFRISRTAQAFAL